MSSPRCGGSTGSTTVAYTATAATCHQQSSKHCPPMPNRPSPYGIHTNWNTTRGSPQHEPSSRDVRCGRHTASLGGLTSLATTQSHPVRDNVPGCHIWWWVMRCSLESNRSSCTITSSLRSACSCKDCFGRRLLCLSPTLFGSQHRSSFWWINGGICHRLQDNAFAQLGNLLRR